MVEQYQYFVVYIRHTFLSQSSVDGLLSCFHVVIIVNTVPVNIGVHVSFQIRVLVFSGIHSGVGMQDHMVALFLIF